MKTTIKISKEALVKKDYKNREVKKVGTLPSSRDREALAVLLKTLKKAT